jgi:hypothetical protein
MQRHIRPCQVAESERRQSARHPVRIAGRRDGPSVRASLMLTGYGGRQCPSCSAHCLSAVSFQPTFGRETILGWGKSEIESRIDDRPTGWSSFWSRQIHGNPPLSHLVALLAAYVIVGNHLYLAKVLPALSRDGLDGSVKFMPSKQFDQIDVFLTRFPPPDRGSTVFSRTSVPSPPLSSPFGWWRSSQRTFFYELRGIT